MAKSKTEIQHDAFVRHYLANGYNGTQAALAAGYAEKSARVTASRLLTQDNIRVKISEAVAATLKDLDLDRLRWFQEVRGIAFSDIRQVAEFGPDGLNWKPSSELTDEAARLIESIESTTTYDKEGRPVVTKKIKLHSKKSGLDTLGKFMGMLKEEQGGGVTIIINGDEADLA